MQSAAEFRRKAQESMEKSAAARMAGDMINAQYWIEAARQYERDAQLLEDREGSPSGRLPAQGEVQAAPVQSPDAGYYYHDAITGQWLPTTSLDAMERKAAGEQIIEPKEH